MSFFDLEVSNSILGQLDDESLQTTGPWPSERVAGLIDSGRLALWSLGDVVDGTPVPGWLSHAEPCSGPLASPFPAAWAGSGRCGLSLGQAMEAADVAGR